MGLAEVSAIFGADLTPVTVGLVLVFGCARRERQLRCPAWTSLLRQSPVWVSAPREVRWLRSPSWTRGFGKVLMCGGLGCLHADVSSALGDLSYGVGRIGSQDQIVQPDKRLLRLRCLPPALVVSLGVHSVGWPFLLVLLCEHGISRHRLALGLACVGRLSGGGYRHCVGQAGT